MLESCFNAPIFINRNLFTDSGTVIVDRASYPQIFGNDLTSIETFSNVER